MWVEVLIIFIFLFHCYILYCISYLQIAVAAKKAIRGTKDYIRQLQRNNETAMDEEEQRMGARLRSRAKEGASGPVEALRKLFITFGNQEIAAFDQQNVFFQSKGMPYYSRIQKGFGFQLYLWTQNTTKVADFVTGIVLSHKDPAHEKHKDLAEEGYDLVEHPNSNLQFWLKRELTKVSQNIFIFFQVLINFFLAGFFRLGRYLQ